MSVRKIRVAVIIFFILSCICYAGYTVKEWLGADRHAPVIKFEEEVLTLKEDNMGEEALLEGVTAQDRRDGDLTDRIQVASLTPFRNGNERTVKYIVFDNSNQLGVAERTVVYEGYTPPRIYIKSPLRFGMTTYKDEIEALEMEGYDCMDGDITDNIRISIDNVSFSKPVSYPIAFQVNNSAGDTCILTMEVPFVDKNSEYGKYYPELKDYVAYTAVGEKIDPDDYLKGTVVNSAGDTEDVSKDSIVVDSDVDYTKAGIYTIDYSYTSQSDVKAVTTLYVVVED